ncbi:MAG: hypothetical protein U0136_21955 [Bdellovibrionota bacterium]
MRKELNIGLSFVLGLALTFFVDQAHAGVGAHSGVGHGSTGVGHGGSGVGHGGGGVGAGSTGVGHGSSGVGHGTYGVGSSGGGVGYGTLGVGSGVGRASFGVGHGNSGLGGSGVGLRSLGVGTAGTTSRAATYSTARASLGNGNGGAGFGTTGPEPARPRGEPSAKHVYPGRMVRDLGHGLKASGFYPTSFSGNGANGDSGIRYPHLGGYAFGGNSGIVASDFHQH